jgi:hypothetical protein
MSSITTGTIGFFCSVLFKKSSISTMAAYMTVVILFAVPVAADLFARVFLPNTLAAVCIESLLFISPIGATFSLPLATEAVKETSVSIANVTAASSVLWSYATAAGFLVLYALLNSTIVLTIIRLFRIRWRVVR